MQFFFNALFITLGILTAILIVNFSVGFLISFFKTLKTNSKRAVQLKMYEDRKKSKEQFLKLAENQSQKILAENSEVSILVEKLKLFPYDDSDTKKARKNNNERSKIQKQIRILVPQKSIRDFYYSNKKI